MARKIESLFLLGPAWRLEALLEEPEDREPVCAALICHPHPQHGGTMHNKVLYRIARGLRRAGCVALRFNYRGVNLSGGSYDDGGGESEDARAALAWLRQRYPALPYLVAGFSFGARIVLNLKFDPPPQQIIVAGFPTRYQDIERESAIPRVFIHSTHDQYGPRVELQAFFDSLTGPKRLHWIESQDHFFADALDALEAAVVGLAE